MSATTRPQYEKLKLRLGVARRAYKRVAALSGAVVFIIEVAGMLSVLILAEVAFGLGPAGRIGLFVLAIASLLFFAFRHIVSPLKRQISDRQLALYLEQRTPEFEGALVAAVEFGPDGSLTGRQADILESILDQAVARATRFDLRRAIDLARLRKYGIFAAVLVVAYSIAAVTMPQTVGRRMARAFTPWKPTPEEIVISPNAAVPLVPLNVDVTPGDTAIVRGGSLQLAALLSRATQGSVGFHFRATSAASKETSWKLQPMTEADRLNTFQLTLPDINEDLEFFVSAENAKSEPHRVSVYDPLLIKSFAITTHYPDYMKTPDHTEPADSPDISAPQGSTITIRTTGNSPLQASQILWDGAAATPATIDPKDPTSAIATFPLTTNGTFHIQISDAHGQVMQTPTPASAVAVVDAPPTIKLLTPVVATINSNPLGEISFSAELADDVALDGADLVIARGTDPKAAPIRTPLVLDPPPTDGTPLTSARTYASLMLEKMVPPLTPGEVLSAYIEVRDRKQQATPSELVQIVIGPFESWAMFPAGAGDEADGAGSQTFRLDPVLQAAWMLHRTASQLAPNDLNRQLEELAKTMVNDKGALNQYYDPEGITPEHLALAQKAMVNAQAGHDALKAHDIETAVVQLRIGVALLNAAGFTDTVVMKQPPPPADAAATASQTAENIQKMNALMEKVTQPSNGGSQSEHSEKDATADTAAQVAKADELEKAQSDLLDKLKKSAEGADAANDKGKSDEAKGEQAKGAQGQSDQAKGAQGSAAQGSAAKAMADAHSKLADKAADAAKSIKDAAGTDANKKGAADDLANAAGLLKEAAGHLNAGDLNKAIQKAESAKEQIASAKGKLQGSSQDAVNNALDKAEAAGDAASRKQGDLLNKTQELAKGGASAKGADAKAKASAIGVDQVKLAADAHDLAATLDGLSKAGDAGGLKTDTAKLVNQAKQQLQRGKVDQHIANAAVQLAAGNAAGAAAEQKKIKDVLDTVNESIRGASGSRAGDLASAVKRAKNEAADINSNLAKLKAAADAKADGKGDAKGNGPEKGETKELADRTADAVARLARQLQARDFANGDKGFAQDEKAIIDKSQDPVKLGDDLAKTPAKVGDLARIAQRVQDHLEEAYETTLKSQQLFAAQREECPPEYRPLVNQYFAALSTTK